MSLATLLVFAVVAACVVVLRYRPEQDVSSSGDNSEVTGLLAGVAENHICNSPQVWPFQSLRPSCQFKCFESMLQRTDDGVSAWWGWRRRRGRAPSAATGRVASRAVLVYGAAATALCLFVSYAGERLGRPPAGPWTLTGVVAAGLLMLVSLGAICAMPQSPHPLAFRVSPRRISEHPKAGLP